MVNPYLIIHDPDLKWIRYPASKRHFTTAPAIVCFVVYNHFRLIRPSAVSCADKHLLAGAVIPQLTELELVRVECPPDLHGFGLSIPQGNMGPEVFIGRFLFEGAYPCQAGFGNGAFADKHLCSDRVFEIGDHTLHRTV